MPMTTIRSSVDIDASADEVFAILMNLEGYPEWNPFTVSVRTTFEMGAPVDMKVQLTARYLRDQREFIREIDPVARRVAWGMTMGAAWIGSGHRRQWVEELGEGRSRYVTEDDIGGVLRPLIIALYGGAMQRGFDGVCRGLKERAEGRADA